MPDDVFHLFPHSLGKLVRILVNVPQSREVFFQRDDRIEAMRVS